MALLFQGGSRTWATRSVASTRWAAPPSTPIDSESIRGSCPSIARRAAATLRGAAGASSAGDLAGMLIELPASAPKGSEVTPSLLLALDRLEEEGRAVLHRASEDLEQVAVLIAVDQDVEFLKPAQVLVDLADAPRKRLVVAVRGAQELGALPAQPGNALDDVLAVQSDVLHPGAVVVVEVLVDLGPAEPLGRFVDREGDAPSSTAADHFAAQGRVLSRDVGLVELLEDVEPEDPVVPADPLVHPGQLHIADAVVDELQPGSRTGLELLAKAGQKTAPVLGALDEGVHRVSERAHGGQPHRPHLVLQDMGLGDCPGAAPDRIVEGGAGVVDGEGQGPHAISMPTRVVGDLPVRSRRGGHHQGDLALLEYVGGAVSGPRFRSLIGDHVEAQCAPIEVGRLTGVSDQELDVVHPFQGGLPVLGRAGEHLGATGH